MKHFCLFCILFFLSPFIDAGNACAKQKETHETAHLAYYLFDQFDAFTAEGDNYLHCTEIRFKETFDRHDVFSYFLGGANVEEALCIAIKRAGYTSLDKHFITQFRKTIIEDSVKELQGKKSRR